MSQPNQLSEYEILRQENIKRNEEFLKTLGLEKLPSTPAVPQKKSSSSSSKRKRESDKDNNNNEDGYFEVDDYISPKEKKTKEVAQPTRRSMRVQNQPPPESHTEIDENDDRVIRPKETPKYNLEINIDEEVEEGRIRITAPQVREVIMATNPDHDELISNEVRIPLILFCFLLFQFVYVPGYHSLRLSYELHVQCQISHSLETNRQVNPYLFDCTVYPFFYC